MIQDGFNEHPDFYNFLKNINVKLMFRQIAEQANIPPSKTD